jgi:hypothetical protein
MKKGVRVLTAAFLITALSLNVGTMPVQGAGSEVQAGHEVEQIKQKEQEIRTLMHLMRADSKKLQQLVHDAKDDNLKKQVREDLNGFHENLKKSFRLHKANQALNRQLETAGQSGEKAKAKKLAEAIYQHQTQQVELLQAAHRDLQAELRKVEGSRH